MTLSSMKRTRRNTYSTRNKTVCNICRRCPNDGYCWQFEDIRNDYVVCYHCWIEMDNEEKKSLVKRKEIHEL
jgi:hypothetical protein